jgi:hypothetical protein
VKKSIKIDYNKINEAVSQSSKMEGLSFHGAKKNKKIIQILKIYGRAFAISRQR